MDIKYNSLIKLDSVLLVYLDQKNNKQKLDLISENGLKWMIPLSMHQKIEKNLDLYAFIINKSFCICDPNCNSIYKVNNMLFSKAEIKLDNKVKYIEIESSNTGKDFQINTFDIIDKTSVFSNLDIAICYKVNLKNITEDSIILFQIINPKGELHFLDFECLKKNKVNGRRIYYAALKITPLLIEGKWIFQLIYKDKIIDTKEVIYKIYKYDYGNRDYFTQNYVNINIEV